MLCVEHYSVPPKIPWQNSDTLFVVTPRPAQPWRVTTNGNISSSYLQSGHGLFAL